jgi:hypothetical protein
VTLGQYAPSFSLLNTKYAAAIVLTPGSPGNRAGADTISLDRQALSHTRPAL